MASIKVQYIDNINDIVRIDNILYYDISTNNYYRGTEETAISNEIKTYEYLRDLPVFTDAEDCLYYVNQKQNTYILNSEKDKWLQVTLNKNEPEEPTIGTGGSIIAGNPFLDITINSDNIVETSLEEIAMTQETKRAITFNGAFLNIIEVIADENGIYDNIKLAGMKNLDEYFSIIIYSNGSYEIIEEGKFQKIKEKVFEINEDSSNNQYPSALAVQKYVQENGGGFGGGSGNDTIVEITNLLEGTEITRAIGADNYIPISFKEFKFDVASKLWIQTDKTGQLKVEYKFSNEEFWKTAEEYNGQTLEQDSDFKISINKFLELKKYTNIRISIMGGEKGVVNTITYTVYSVDARIRLTDENFHLEVYQGNTTIEYFCQGESLDKQVVAYLDDVLFYENHYGTSVNTKKLLSIPLATKNLSYGVHKFRLFFKTPDGLESNKIEKDILYDNKNRDEPIYPLISLQVQQETVLKGEPLLVNYVIFSPQENVEAGIKETTDYLTVTLIRKYEEKEDEAFKPIPYDNIPALTETGQPHTWSFLNYDEEGKYEIKFEAWNNNGKKATASAFIEVKVPQSIYDNLEIHQDYLVFQFNATQGSNTNANRKYYDVNYTTLDGQERTLSSTLEGFNYDTDGYIQDQISISEYDDQSLKFIGQGKYTINVPILTSGFLDKNNEWVNLEDKTSGKLTTNGRTIEFDFKVSNVIDPTEPIIKCITENHAGFVITPSLCYLLSSNGNNIEIDSNGFIKNEKFVAAAYLKAEQRIRVSFVIEEKGHLSYVDDYGSVISYQSINIYVNGKFAQSFFYNDDADFVCNLPITIEPKKCILNLYNVCLYNSALSHDEIRHNYCTSPLTISEKENRLRENDFLSTNDKQEWEIDYEKAKKYFNCLLIIGELSTIKKDWKNCGIILTKPVGDYQNYVTEFNHTTRDSKGNFVSRNAVQGTTSQTYPTKNCYIQLKEYNSETKQVDNKYYSLAGYDETGSPLSIEETQFCWKADFMSTDHANTFNANLANNFYDDILDSQNPDKGGDERARSTVYGFRCLLFNQKNELSPIELVGDGALNVDKETPRSYGLVCPGDNENQTTRQRWEYGANGDKIGGFQSDRFFKRENGVLKPIHAEAILEPNYPDVDNPNYFYIQTMYTWVCQRANFWDASSEILKTPKTYDGVQYYTERDYKKAIFYKEFKYHFNLNRMLVYYLFMEFIALADNREKNMFMRCEDVYLENLTFLNGANSLEDCIADDGTVDAEKIDWLSSTFAIWMPDLYDLDTCYGVDNVGELIIPYYADWDYEKSEGAYGFNGRDSRLWLMFEEAFKTEIKNHAQEMAKNKGLTYNNFVNKQITANNGYNVPALVNRDMIVKYINPVKYGFVKVSEGDEGDVVEISHTTQYKYLQRGDRENQKLDFMNKRFILYDSKYQTQSFTNDTIYFRSRTELPFPDNSVTIKANTYFYPAIRYTESGKIHTTTIDNKGELTELTSPVAPNTNITLATELYPGEDQRHYFLGASNIIDIGDISKFKPYDLSLENAKKLQRLILGAGGNYTNTGLGNVNTISCPLLEEINIEGCTVADSFTLANNRLIKNINISRSNVGYLKLPVGGFIENLKIGAPTTISIRNHQNLKTFSYDNLNQLQYIRVEKTPNVNALNIIKQRGMQNLKGVRLVGIEETFTNYNDFKPFIDYGEGKRLIDDNTLDGTNAYPIISGTITFTDKIYWSEVQEINRCYGTEQAYPLTIQGLVYARVTFKDYNGNTLATSETLLGGSVNYTGDTPWRSHDSNYAYRFSGWSRQQNQYINDPDALKNITQDITVYATYTRYDKYVDKIISYGDITRASIGDTMLNNKDNMGRFAKNLTYGDIIDYGLSDYSLVSFAPKSNITFERSDGATGSYPSYHIIKGYQYETKESITDSDGNVTGYDYPATYNSPTSESTQTINPYSYNSDFSIFYPSAKPTTEFRLFQHNESLNTSSDSTKYSVWFGVRNDYVVNDVLDWSKNSWTYFRAIFKDIEIKYRFIHNDFLNK